MNKVELLAPAGSFEALKAGVAAGANAVYLGGSGFGARAFAKNFDNDEMIEAIKFAHLYNVKIYVTLNTITYDHEMKNIFNYVKFLYQNDVDAIIVQDLGLMEIIRSKFPDLEIHASTQMTIHNLDAVKFLKAKGINRVVLARENTITQIKRIVDETGIDVEVFVHGAICVCYSGQCLMSGLIGGRSGNRGKCAQPCRRRYSLKVNDETIENKKYLLSPKDLNTIENIDKIIESGIKSLKIEGRMKSPEYVAIVVNAYRKAIDYYYEHKKVFISEEDISDITQIFNRKFTKGFLFNEKGNEFINLDKNNNTGLLIGKVVSCDNNKLKVKLTHDLNLNDGIYFDNTEVGMTVSKLIVNNKETKQAKANDLVILDVPVSINKNTEVYKTTDAVLEDKARLIGSMLQIIPINIEVDLFINQKPKIKVTDNLGNRIDDEIEFMIEESKNQMIDNKKITEQLSKLGNTPF
ncbi:MAG: putative peptidase family, partial [Haloplasmataceae bacterium]|nr:putative peptidase family [Haloplasmataceae bacterium]